MFILNVEGFKTDVSKFCSYSLMASNFNLITITRNIRRGMFFILSLLSLIIFLLAIMGTESQNDFLSSLIPQCTEFLEPFLFGKVIALFLTIFFL